jgi:hypothetical protein
MGGSRDLLALADIGGGKLGIEMIEHGLGRAWCCREIALDGSIHLPLAVGDELFLL